MSLGLEYAKSIYVRLIGDIFHLWKLSPSSR
jgi:hypothetical protein